LCLYIFTIASSSSQARCPRHWFVVVLKDLVMVLNLLSLLTFL